MIQTQDSYAQQLEGKVIISKYIESYHTHHKIRPTWSLNSLYIKKKILSIKKKSSIPYGFNNFKKWGRFAQSG